VEGLKDGQVRHYHCETRPKWAPIGVEHFHKLVENKFYDQCRFFRVVDDFMVSGESPLLPKCKGVAFGHIKDDPTVMTNKRGLLPMRPAAGFTHHAALSIHGRMEMVSWMDGALLRLEKLSRNGICGCDPEQVRRNRVKARLLTWAMHTSKRVSRISPILFGPRCH
jgi:hypothetical protein